MAQYKVTMKYELAGSMIEKEEVITAKTNSDAFIKLATKHNNLTVAKITDYEELSVRLIDPQ